MIFSSSLFLFAFFPVFFTLYYLAPSKMKNTLIILGSLFFYIWGARSFVLIALGTLWADWIIGNIIHLEGPNSNDERRSSRIVKICIAIDVVMNIGLLLYFKYFNFFADNLNALLVNFGVNPFTYTKVLLPIGVSFIIFQKLTYCIDIACGKSSPAKKFFHLVEYLFVFPQIIAGPIVKYNEIAEQIQTRELTWDKFLHGFQRFSIGLFKKVWIADNLAKYADNAFSMGSAIPFDYAWIGIFAYTFQIFFDFAAYSDMAIGMLSMMGFKIGENFNMPYISKSVTEFWKRWHISLTSWFREYLYFPLGGNRKNKVRTYVNQLIIFLISGFWHGAAWNFVFWGAYHGVIVCVEKSDAARITEQLPKSLKWFITFVLVMIGWVFFRADGIQAGLIYLKNMFDISNYYVHINPYNIMVIDPRGWAMFALAAIISFFPAFEKPYDKIMNFVKPKKTFVAIGCFALFTVAALKVITGTISPFIYFRF